MLVSNNKSTVVFFSFKIIEFEGCHYDLIKFELVHFLKGVTSVLFNKMCPRISIDSAGLLIRLYKNNRFIVVVES